MRPGHRRLGKSSSRFPSRALAVLCVLLLTLPSLATVASQEGGRVDGDESREAASADEWLTYKADNQRTGVAVSDAPSVDRVLWKQEYSGSVIYSSPSVWNETVYIGVAGSIRAIWAKNGSERWTYIAPNPIHSAPVIDNGVIYTGVNDFYGTGAVAVDARTGVEVWNASIPDFCTASPLVQGSSVYVGCQNGLLYCLRKSDGHERWNFSAGNSILYGSIAFFNGLIYFGIRADSEQNGRVFALDADSGEEAWNRTVIGSVWSSPSVSMGRVLVSTAADQSLGAEFRNGYVYAFNTSSGQQEWRSRNLGMVMASPSVKDGRVYVGTFGKFLNDVQLIAPQMYCLQLGSGSILWNKTVRHGAEIAKVWSSVSIAGAKIIFGDELGYLNVWNTNGVRIWDHTITEGAAVKVSPAVASNMVFAANTLGDVVGFGSQPDLSVNASSIQVSDARPHLGQRVNVRAKITNVGDKAATGRVFLYNGSMEDWHTVINGTTVTLGPGRSTFVSAVWTADEVGTRAVWVRIMDVVPNEADESNNEALRIMEVLPPSEGWLLSRADKSGAAFMATGPPSNNITKWLRAEGDVPGPGLVASMDAVLYPVGQRLVALDRLDGTVVWSHDLEAAPSTPPGIGDGAAFVGTGAGKLWARDLEDGTVRFTRVLDGPVTAGPTVVGRVVMVGTSTTGGGGTLWALDTFDGTELWSRDMGGSVRAHPASAGNATYAVSNDGAILSLNLSDGGLLWQFPVGSTPGTNLTAAPVVKDGRLFVASTSGFVYCLDSDPSDGVDEGKDDPEGSSYDVVWTYKQASLLPFTRSPVLVDGRLVLQVGDDVVLALNATNGNISWEKTVTFAGSLTMDMVAVNGSIVVGGVGIHILGTETGSRTWSYTGTTAPMVNGPTALDDMLFVVDDRGIIFAFGKVENLPPVARISTPTSGQTFRINDTITFDGSTSSDDKELPESSFLWNFGDGNSSISSVTSHKYERPGLYTVTLTVTDTDGESDNTSIEVNIKGNLAPLLDWWKVTPEQGDVSTMFNFSVRYTDPDNDPPTYVRIRLARDEGFPERDMAPVDPGDDDYTDGRIYYYLTTLGSRPYDNVTYTASDGIADISLVVTGPLVIMEGRFANSVGDVEVTAHYVGPNEVRFIPVPSPPENYPPGKHPIGLFVELDLDTTFLESVHISINYSFREVAEINVSTLTLYRWIVSETQSYWEAVPGSTVDEAMGIVQGPIASLQNDIYTVLGEKLKPPENRRPMAIIEVDGETYGPGATVKVTYSPGDVISFDGSASYDPDRDLTNDQIVYWGWSFGDGTSVEGKVANHQYQVPNKYTVTLTVRDSFDGESTVTVVINVRTEGESNLLFVLVIICIIIILFLLFFPKGGAKTQPAKAEPKEPVVAPEEEDDAVEGAGEDPEADQTELDDIIDELEEDRNK